MGSLSDVSPTALAAVALAGAVEKDGFEASGVERVYLGNIAASGSRANPAGAAAHDAGLPAGLPCFTIRAGCASGLMAVSTAAEAILAGACACALAGGFESASAAPHLVEGLRRGLRLGPGVLVDAARRDGPAAAPAGSEAEGGRLLEAHRRGDLRREIVPVEVASGKRGQPRLVDRDDAVAALEGGEGPAPAGDLPPLADGAAALLLASDAWAARRGLAPFARLTVVADPIGEMAAGPRWIEADVTEERIASLLGSLPASPSPAINPRGGGAILGHAAGADGARLLVSLVHALRAGGGGRGLALAAGAWGETAAVVAEVGD